MEIILVNVEDFHPIIKSSPTFATLIENDESDSNNNIPVTKKFIFHNLEIENYEKFMHI